MPVVLNPNAVSDKTRIYVGKLWINFKDEKNKTDEEKAVLNSVREKLLIVLEKYNVYFSGNLDNKFSEIPWRKDEPMTIGLNKKRDDEPNDADLRVSFLTKDVDFISVAKKAGAVSKPKTVETAGETADVLAELM
jgi:hypothetical protein